MTHRVRVCGWMTCLFSHPLSLPLPFSISLSPPLSLLFSLSLSLYPSLLLANFPPQLLCPFYGFFHAYMSTPRTACPCFLNMPQSLTWHLCVQVRVRVTFSKLFSSRAKRLLWETEDPAVTKASLVLGVIIHQLSDINSPLLSQWVRRRFAGCGEKKI